MTLSKQFSYFLIVRLIVQTYMTVMGIVCCLPCHPISYVQVDELIQHFSCQSGMDRVTRNKYIRRGVIVYVDICNH